MHAAALLFFFVNACAVALALRLNRGRMFVYNLAFVFGALGLFELYLVAWPLPKASHEGTYSSGGFLSEILIWDMAFRPKVASGLAYSKRPMDPLFMM
jgi:hypothetical protein